jgi:hypothetical protein
MHDGFRNSIRRLSPWRSIIFRYFAYGAAVYGGRLVRWLTSSWRQPLLWIAAVAALAILRRAWIAGASLTPPLTVEKLRAALSALIAALPNPIEIERRLEEIVENGAAAELLNEKPAPSVMSVAGEALRSWDFPIEVLVATAIAWTAIYYWRGRNRLLVLAPVNHAGDAFKDFADGLELRIMNELKRLRSLHAMPDRGRAAHGGTSLEAGAGKSLDQVSGLRIGVNDDVARFSALIDNSAAVSVGPAKISLRPLFALFATLSRRNRLRSSLHRDGNMLVMAAELSGGGAWRIERMIPDGASADERAKQLEGVFDELVYSVFSTLSQLRQLDWAALQHFSQGLWALQSAQVDQLNRLENLREAERQLLAVRGLSQDFSRCSYLLGIVYEELADLAKTSDQSAAANWQAAARATFIQALAEDPRNLDAAYAIAWQSYQRGAIDSDQYAFAVEFAGRMLEVDPTDARALNIRGVAGCQLRRKTVGEAQQAWNNSLEDRRAAAAYLWRSLCGQAWSGQISSALRADQTDYFTNLGVAIWNANLTLRFYRMKRVLLQGLHDNPATRPAFELAKVMGDSAVHQSGAETMFQKALFNAKTFPERVQVRARLAASLYKRAGDNSQKVQDVLSILVESPSVLTTDACNNLAVVMRNNLVDNLLPDKFYLYRRDRLRAKKDGLPEIVAWPEFWTNTWIAFLNRINEKSKANIDTVSVLSNMIAAVI